MNFKTHNDKNVEIFGTSLQGYVSCDYKKIKSIFGKPVVFESGCKVDAEWGIEFENGLVATIYNYKDGKNYNGKEGLPKTKITEWHIGGRDKSVVKLIQDLLK